jgi:hypothetical protein
MSNRIETTKDGTAIVIDGFENGIAVSPYKGIANIRNLSTAYYPNVAYVNYRRQSATLSDGSFYAGTHSINVSNNTGWIFTAPSTQSIGNPVQKAVSPLGLVYILDDQGNVFKQSSVGGTTFNLLQDGGGRFTNGAGGLAYWNNYLWVFGKGLIEVCGDGTGDAGITSANWNLNSGSGFAHNGFIFITDYSVVPFTFTVSVPYGSGHGTPRLKQGDSISFTTTGTLPSPLVVGTTYYVGSSFGNGAYAVSTSMANAYTLLTGTVSTGATTATLKAVWGGTTGTYGIIFSDGITKSTTLTNGSASFSWSGGLASDVTDTVSIVIALTSNGTGVQTVNDNSSPLPLGNSTHLNVNFSGSYPYTGLSFLTSGSVGYYVSPTGVTISGSWKEASGLYNIIMSNGQKIPANFTNGSPDINLLSSVSLIGYGTDWQVEFLDPTVTFYRPYVSKVDGSLYFCNGQFIGRIAGNADPNVAFNPSLPNTYVVSFGVTSIPEQFQDTVTDMVDLKSTLVVAGQKDVYAWDYVSASTSSPSPVGENITGITNLLNNVYVFAGHKGNMYITNGYSAQFLYKLPDYLSGVIDPIWTWGGIMTKRSRLWFQALAQKTDGTNVLAGVFSIVVSPSMIGESASGLVMEAQNSYGLTSSTGATGAGLLIDNPTPNYDSYYSVWSNGATSGGIDYNDSSLWQNYEPVIETDLVYLGSVMQKKSLGQMEFLLDRPMATGDSIRMSWRSSLTDSYSTPVTFTTATIPQLADYGVTNLDKKQWVQFKIEFKCSASGSSFLPIREMRVHLI